MTPERARAVEAFKRRLAEYLPKESRCPGCAKAKRVDEGTTGSGVCRRHQELRWDLVTSGRKG